MKSAKLLSAAIALALVSASSSAQQAAKAPNSNSDGKTTSATPAAAPARPVSTQPPIEIQRMRALDQRGINVFEAPKNDNVPYDGFKLAWGAAFTQQFQGLDHRNTASPKLVNNVDVNKLMRIGHGFNNAGANLYLNAQLAPGIRVALTSYLSSRHHNETWVKDGYLLIDESPLRLAPLQTIMKYVTVRAGHFEVNYGDEHFRRSDNGNAIYNPFVGNLITDAFTTEIGGEVYARSHGFIAMAGMTGGEIRGNITKPADRSPAYMGKLGFDRQVTTDLRVRLTGSTFQQASAISNTLYAGDRAGSRYFFVMENTSATESANATSGYVAPGFSDKVKSYMLNPFMKYRGLEIFGVAETSKGRSAAETRLRDWHQYSTEAVYRFLAGDKLFVGARYNTVHGQLNGFTTDVKVNRGTAAMGWFLTQGVLLKGEYATQKYFGFPIADIRSGGRFNGFMVEGVVAF